MSLECSACHAPGLTPEDFSKLSLEILRLNPQSAQRLKCAACLTAARNPAAQPAAAKPAAQPASVPPAAARPTSKPRPTPAVAAKPASAAPVKAAAAAPQSSDRFTADQAFDLGEAILETSTIAPSEAGSDDDNLEDELAEAGLVGGPEDDGLDDVDPSEDDGLWGSGRGGCAAVVPKAKAAASGLTSAALAQHDQATDKSERRQFNCPHHGTFWNKVLARKPVARCDQCGDASAKYEAIPVEEERGRGFFKCDDCGNAWTSNSACRGLAQYCQAAGCTALDHQKGTFPAQVS